MTDQVNNKNLPLEFKKLKVITEPFRQRLYFVGILTKYLRKKNLRPVIVGGNAVEVYTLGSYAIGDIVYPDAQAAGELLSSWGFKKMAGTGFHLTSTLLLKSLLP